MLAVDHAAEWRAETIRQKNLAAEARQEARLKQAHREECAKAQEMATAIKEGTMTLSEVPILLKWDVERALKALNERERDPFYIQREVFYMGSKISC